MNIKLLTRTCSLLLCGVLLLPLLASCTGGRADVTSTASPDAANEVAPDQGTPDRSDLMYLDAIDEYKKTDWTAQWIWTEGCSEDSYVAF